MRLLQANYLSLNKKIIDAHLMIGLGCILSCIVAVEFFAWQQTLFEFLPAVVAAPLLVLCISSILLRKNLKSFIAIERQLHRVSTEVDPASWRLAPLNCLNSATLGWNRMIEQVQTGAIGNSLVRKLEQAFGSSDSNTWKTIADSIPDALLVTNADADVRKWNSSLELLVSQQIAADSIANSTLKDILACLITENADEQITSVASLPMHRSCEVYRSLTAMDEGIWQVIRLPINDPSFTGSSLWVIRDVTQREIVEYAREQFLFTATHELRTPIANIRAYAETLAMADDIDATEQKGFINIINTEASRLARFIDDLLNISQMEAGAITVDRHETDVMRMLLELQESMHSLLEKKQQVFDCKLPPKLPKLWIDKDKITGAITNLLSNANKYTPVGGEVRLIVEEDNEHLNIHVEDTGYGISETELPKIMQKFFRSEDERVRGESGSGIGLAFSQEVAKLHGGRILVQSELNKGSRFTLSLPMSLRKQNHV